MQQHRRGCHALLLSAALYCCPLSAFASDAVILRAPESVQGLLRSYVELPEQAIKDDAERATLLRRLQKEVAELLATEGYFSSKVYFQQESEQEFLVVEIGTQASVSSIALAFKGDIAANEPRRQQRVAALRSQWRLPEGALFRSEDWESAKTELVAQIAEQDYMLANLAYSQAEIDPETNSMKLTVVIDSGPAFIFDEVRTEGMKRYDPQLVHRFAQFKKGEPYQRDKLLSFQTRLQSMPQFSSVRVSGEPDLSQYELTESNDSNPQPLALPIVVRVEEIRPRKMSVGLGFSSNHGPRAEINFRDHRFAEQLWDMQSTLRLEQERQTWTGNVDTLPDERQYVYSLGATGEMTQVENLDTWRHKVSFARSRSLKGIERRLTLSWQQELQRNASGDENNTQALVLDWLWHKRAVDNPLNPRAGYSTQVRIGGASSTILSTQNFLRSYLHHQWWLPLDQYNIINLRGELGWTLARTRLDVPQEYLFRSGGTQTIRGYDYQSLGVAENGSIVGGRVSALASVEYTHWLRSKWGAAVFVDLGNSADSWQDYSPVFGYGLGARWLSPVGPLALDLATGNTEHQWKPHFSISVAF